MFIPSSYERLRRLLEGFPIPCPPGKSILKFLKFVFTEQEAEAALIPAAVTFDDYFKIIFHRAMSNLKSWTLRGL